MPFSWETNAAPAPATGGAFSWEKTPSPAQQLAGATQKAAPYVGMGDVQVAGQAAPTPPQYLSAAPTASPAPQLAQANPDPLGINARPNLTVPNLQIGNKAGASLAPPSSQAQLRAATSADQPPAPWWKNAEGAIGKFNDLITGAGGGVTDKQTQDYAAYALTQPGLSPSQKAYYQGIVNQGKAPENLGAQMVENSPFASGFARTIGSTIPYIAAGMGVKAGMGAAGLDDEAMSSLPTAQRLASAAGSSAAGGLSATVLQGKNPLSREGLQNALMMMGWEGGAAGLSKLAKIVPWIPDILSKPLGAGGGAVAGNLASYPAMTPDQRTDLKGELINQGLTAVATEGFMTLMEGRGAFIPEHVRNATHQVTQQAASDQDQRDAAPGQLQGMPEGKLSPSKKTELTVNQMFTDAVTGKGDPATRDQILNNYSLEAINIRRKQNGLPPVAGKGEIYQNAPSASQEAAGAGQTPAGEKYATPALGADNWKPGDPMVDTSPMNLQVLSNDKETSRDWRQELSSKQNAQVVRGNQVGDAIAKMAPGEDEAITISRELHGDKAEIQKFIDNPDPRMDQLMENSKETYRQAAVKALNLSGNAVQAEGMENQYYDESGNHSKELGTINNILEDYTNHLYKPEKATDFVKTEGRKPGLSTYTSHRKQRVYSSQLHALLGLDEDDNPITDDEGNPIKGKTPVSMKSSELLKLHNEDMARVNTNMEFLNAVSDKGMGKWVQGSAPEGWTKIEGMQKETAVGGTGGITPDLIDKYLAARHLDPTKMTTNQKISEVDKLGKTVPNSVRLAIQDIKDDIAGKVDKNGTKPMIIRHDFAMPDGLAKGIGAAIEPNFIKRVDALRGIQKYQGIVKTVDLSYSAFHHLNMLAQLLYQTKGGIDILANVGKIKAMMKDPGGFNQMEQDFVRHTGMTAEVEANQDILRKLTEGDDLVAKMSRAPVVKQFLKGAEKSSDFLFGTLQRYTKVLDYQNKVMSAIAKTPDMTDADLVSTKRGVAREVNNAYGGLNWRALGVSRSMQSVMRLFFLAPDWTVSNVLLAKDALGGWKGPERAAAGGASRASLGLALVGGEILTQGLSYLLTGHFTDKNPKGHEQEVEVQPGVYVSMFRGGPGDAVKLASDIIRYGPQGAAMFAQGKLSPIARTIVGLMSNTDYMGRKIGNASKSWAQNAAAFGSFIANSALPVPFGASETSQYLFGDKGALGAAKQYLQTGNPGMNKQATPAGAALVASGLGRSTSTANQTGSVFDKPSKVNQGNYLANAFDPQERQDNQQINAMKGLKTTQDTANKQMEEEIGWKLLGKKAISPTDRQAINQIFSQYKVPANKRRSILDAVEKKLQMRDLEPAAQEYVTMTATERKQYLAGMSPEDKAALKDELLGSSYKPANRAGRQMR